MKVKVKRYTDLVKYAAQQESFKMFEAGEFSFKGAAYFNSLMIKSCGKQIDVNDNGYYNSYRWEPWMYEVVKEEYRPFEEFWEIPENALFREKYGSFWNKIEAFNQGEKLVKFNTFGIYTLQNLYEVIEMSTDRGSTWGVAGVKL